VNYLLLTKPRSIALLLMTALGGMVVAGGEIPSPALLTLTMLGGALAAGGANCLNCYLDRHLDRQMARTKDRPLPAGRLQPRQALLFGLGLCGAAIPVLAVGVNVLSAILAAAGILYYVVIYTRWLKRTSPWSVVFGGGAGVLPLLVGWTAVSGQLSLAALWLGTVVFLWTPPHFWSLALLRHRDYALVDLPMLPTVLGRGETCRQITIYASLLMALTLVAVPAGVAGAPFLVAALLLGTLLLHHSIVLLAEASNEAAQGLYRYSMVYLALLFGALILDRVVWRWA